MTRQKAEERSFLCNTHTHTHTHTHTLTTAMLISGRGGWDLVKSDHPCEQYSHQNDQLGDANPDQI